MPNCRPCRCCWTKRHAPKRRSIATPTHPCSSHAMRLPDWEARLIGALTNPASHENARGIAIYRNARLAILRTALAGAYPVCRALVGEDCFDALVRDTLAVQASTSPNL